MSTEQADRVGNKLAVERLSDDRFVVVTRLFRGLVFVAGCFAMAALVAAIRWW